MFIVYAVISDASLGTAIIVFFEDIFRYSKNLVCKVVLLLSLLLSCYLLLVSLFVFVFFKAVIAIGVVLVIVRLQMKHVTEGSYVILT